MNLEIHMQLTKNTGGLLSSGFLEILMYPYRESNENSKEALFNNKEELFHTHGLFNDMGTRIRNILSRNQIPFCPASHVASKRDFPKDVQVHYLSLSSDPDINDTMMKILFFKDPYNTNQPFFNDASSAEWKTMLDNGSHVNNEFINILFATKLISSKGYSSLVGSPPSLQLSALRASSREEKNSLSLPQHFRETLISSALHSKVS